MTVDRLPWVLVGAVTVLQMHTQGDCTLHGFNAGASLVPLLAKLGIDLRLMAANAGDEFVFIGDGDHVAMKRGNIVSGLNLCKLCYYCLSG